MRAVDHLEPTTVKRVPPIVDLYDLVTDLV
jgi:hypothetical protein